MQNVDKVTLVQSIFLILVAAAVGCGDGSKQRLDAGADGPPDLAPAHTMQADGLAPADAANADGTVLADLAPADAPPSVDANPGETALDTSQVDAIAARDVAEAEARPSFDTTAGEAGNTVDAMAIVDALGTTMATITFQLANQRTQTVYLHSQCWLPITVTAEADGASYDNQQFCGCNCADSACTAAVMCGPCPPPTGAPLEAGKTMNITWTARKSTMQTKTGTTGQFQCVAHAPIATGNYRVAVVVYPTEADAAAKTNGKTTEQSFALGTTSATVVVPIP